MIVAHSEALCKAKTTFGLYRGLLHPLHQFICSEICISREHPRITMSDNLHNFENMQATLLEDHAADRFMTQVVEPEIS
jgi:hypothetical protein